MDPKYTKNCISCKPTTDPEEEARTLFQNQHLKIVLRADNQIWLGRCIIVPKEHVSPATLYSERTDLLLEISNAIAMLNNVYKTLFGMSMANIAQLGNLTEDEEGKKTSEDGYFHVHFHYIPRYEKPVHMYNTTFVDPQWGKALNIDPKAGLPVFVPTKEIIAAIKEDVKKTLDFLAYI
jgi:diadenosine tetraphosphate (Ap4A) HIT family hydrolase